LNIAALRQNHLSVVSSRRNVCRRRMKVSALVVSFPYERVPQAHEGLWAGGILPV
jgi:hypothetical protein